MGLVEGVNKDGSAFSRRVTARTKRLMIRTPLRTIDITGIVDASALEVFEVGFPEGVEPFDLAPLAELTRLEEISLHSTSPADLTPLGRCASLKSVCLTIGGAEPIDLRPLGAIPELSRLSVSAEDQSALDLGPLASARALESISISGGEWRTLELKPLAGLRLRHVVIDTGYLTEIDLVSIAHPSLESLSLMEQGFERLSLGPLRRCERLRSVSLEGNEMDWIDLDGVAALTSLERFGWPNCKHVFIGDDVQILAPALQGLKGG